MICQGQPLPHFVLVNVIRLSYYGGKIAYKYDINYLFLNYPPPTSVGVFEGAVCPK
jgi:hypothetical protein